MRLHSMLFAGLLASVLGACAERPMMAGHGGQFHVVHKHHYELVVTDGAPLKLYITDAKWRKPVPLSGLAASASIDRTPPVPLVVTGDHLETTGAIALPSAVVVMLDFHTGKETVAFDIPKNRPSQ